MSQASARDSREAVALHELEGLEGQFIAASANGQVVGHLLCGLEVECLPAAVQVLAEILQAQLGGRGRCRSGLGPGEVAPCGGAALGLTGAGPRVDLLALLAVADPGLPLALEPDALGVVDPLREGAKGVVHLIPVSLLQPAGAELHRQGQLLVPDPGPEIRLPVVLEWHL